MTKQDFIQRKQQADRSGKRVSSIYLVVFLLLLGANVFLVKWVPKQYAWVNLILFFGLLTGNLFLARRLEIRRVDEFNLRCTICRTPLTKTLGQIAIATGNCGNCGAHLFSN